MGLLKKFKDFIAKEQLFNPNERLLLAVSGGLDSVVLCELCRQSGYDFMIAHCNFQLRAEESERDANFVKQLSEKYGAPFIIKNFDTASFAEKNKLSVQVAARQLRYQWFHELLTSNIKWAIGNSEKAIGNNKKAIGNSEKALSPSNEDRQTGNNGSAKWILTAHHADDNIETLLMNFFKGTGISGLRAILPRQGKILRPLLFAQKQELAEFAELNQLDFAEDSSNVSDKYTRNYFRHHLVPVIRKVFPRVEENLMDNLQRFRDIETLYQQSMDLHKKSLLEYKGSAVHIPVLKLLKAIPLPTIVYEICKPFGFSAGQTPDILSLVNADSGKYVSSSTHRILRNRKWLIITPLENTHSAHILIEAGEQNILFENGSIAMAIKSPGPLNTDPAIAQLDTAMIKFPLLLRKWKKGDYFYPLGMQKKKKLSRFFIDKKLSLVEKENTWVVEMDKKIIWVVGLRIDDRFKIKPATKAILQLQLISSH